MKYSTHRKELLTHVTWKIADKSLFGAIQLWHQQKTQKSFQLFQENLHLFIISEAEQMVWVNISFSNTHMFILAI